MDSFGKSDFRRVNNKGAFLMGIIRRVKTEGPDRTHRTSDLDRMNKSVRSRLTDLIDKVFTSAHMCLLSSVCDQLYSLGALALSCMFTVFQNCAVSGMGATYIRMHTVACDVSALHFVCRAFFPRKICT